MRVPQVGGGAAQVTVEAEVGNERYLVLFTYGDDLRHEWTDFVVVGLLFGHGYPHAVTNTSPISTGFRLTLTTRTNAILSSFIFRIAWSDTPARRSWPILRAK